MKWPALIFILATMIACSQPDSMYEGPVVNGKCALDVFPPDVSANVKPPVDTVKHDPLIRQGGVMVCRAF